MTETLNPLQLMAAGVQFKSFTEQYFDLAGMFREAIIGFLAAIAKQECVRFSERIKAEQARGSKAPGRPALGEDVVAELRRLRGKELNFKNVQMATGVPVATMHKYLINTFRKRAFLKVFAATSATAKTKKLEFSVMAWVIRAGWRGLFLGAVVSGPRLLQRRSTTRINPQTTTSPTAIASTAIVA